MCAVVVHEPAVQKPEAATLSAKNGSKGPTRNDLSKDESSHPPLKMCDATGSDQTSAFSCGTMVNARRCFLSVLS